MTNRSVWIVIPAYNEAPNLGNLLARIAQLTLGGATIRSIVVDDGSTDEITSVVSRLSSAPLVVRHASNQGLGPTLRDGLAEAVSRGFAADIVVTMDGDNTHSPESIPAMVREIDAGADVVIASRYCPGHHVSGVPPIRRLLSRAASLLMRVRFPAPGLRDYTSGYRAYRNSLLQRFFASNADQALLHAGFQVTTKLLLAMRRLGARFSEVPIILDYGAKIGPSKMRIMQTIFNTLRLLVKNSAPGPTRG